MTVRLGFVLVGVLLLLANVPVIAADPEPTGAVLIDDRALDDMTAGNIGVQSFAEASAFGNWANTYTSNFVQSYALPRYEFGSSTGTAWGLGQMVQVQVAASATAGYPTVGPPSGFPASASAVSNVYLFFFGPGR